MKDQLDNFYLQFHEAEVPPSLTQLDVPALEKRRVGREVSVWTVAFVLAWIFTSAPTWTPASVQPSFAWSSVLGRQLEPVASLDAEEGK